MTYLVHYLLAPEIFEFRHRLALAGIVSLCLHIYSTIILCISIMIQPICTNYKNPNIDLHIFRYLRKANLLQRSFSAERKTNPFSFWPCSVITYWRVCSIYPQQQTLARLYIRTKLCVCSVDRQLANSSGRAWLFVWMYFCREPVIFMSGDQMPYQKSHNKIFLAGCWRLFLRCIRLHPRGFRQTLNKISQTQSLSLLHIARTEQPQ